MFYLLFPLFVCGFASLSMVPIGGQVTPIWGLTIYPFVLVILPLADVMLDKLHRPAEALAAKPIHEFALALILPMMALLILGGLYQLEAAGLSWQDALIMGLAIGMVSGAIGMTAAHEMIHRQNKAWRALGIGVLVLVQYGHFRIEHIYGHHVHVGTEKDPATARRGEGFYRFFMRVVRDSYRSAWQIERRRLTNRGEALWGRHNRMLHYALLQIAVLVIAFWLAGGAGLVLMAAQTLIALLLTEAVDYIQHYGLTRTRNAQGRLEPIAAHHSWNSRHAAGDWTTFNIGLHSHHHTEAKAPYPALSQDVQDHEMPGNYAVMIALALLPPLWFRIMDKRLPA